MEMRQLRYLVAVADELNFTRAAARCHVSQPPLSRAIAQLEGEVGARLFERDPHRVSLTAAGISLVDDARRILELTDRAKRRATQVALGLSGQITVGFGGSASYALLPAVIQRFHRLASEVDISFRALPVTAQIDALREGVIDLGILRLPVHDELIQTQFLHREALTLALPASHPLLAKPGPIRLQQLAEHRLVTYEARRGFNYHADLYALCRLAGFEPAIAHQAGTTEAVVGMVACGEGVALVPSSARRLGMRGVAFRPIDSSDIPRRLRVVSFGLAWRGDGASASTLRFVQLMRRRDALPDGDE